MKNERLCECGNHDGVMRLVRLLCEYAENPLGIDTLKPRFSWNVECSLRGHYQTAYRIMVASSMKNLESDTGDMWDSGRVVSGDSVGVEYAGKELVSRGIYFWKVCIWDNDGNLSGFSEIARFEMGLLKKEDWKAVWLGFHGAKCGQSVLIRKEFTIPGKPLKARVYMSGLGYSELRFNGARVGDNVLDPGCTEYEKSVLYVTHDVTGNIKEGLNVVGFVLGNGWYASTALLFQLEVITEDGRETVVASEAGFNDWQISSGPIQANSIYDGEIYDAREEKTGWETAGYLDEDNMDRKTYFANWTAPCLVHGPSGKLTSQMLEPIKVVSDIKPVSIAKVKENIYVYDMGQNFAGWVKLKVTGTEGTKITMRFAETLYDDGTVNQENLRTALARDIYILKGGGEEIYEPRFTYHGFRYVQLEDFPGEPTLETVTGRIVRSSVDISGSFSCSNELINRIHSNVVWTEVSNLHSIPTDCPQRNERHGWLNDATVRGEETVYNFNMSRFFPKWINDIADAQDDETGGITDTAPYAWGWKPADPVCSSYLNIPWLLYHHYGDKRTLERYYEGFKKWNQCLGNMADQYIIEHSRIGDWAPPADEGRVGGFGEGAVSKYTPGSLMSTGFYYYNAKLLSKIARVIGRDEDIEAFEQLAENIKKAFNDKFFNSETANYATGNQSSNVFPLFMGIAPEEYKGRILENIVKDIEKRNYHVSTGNLCTKYILEVLTENGYADIAYKLVAQTTYPSWGHMISKGATTMWERWEYETTGAMNSHNHPMYATVGSWFYKYLAGIKVDENVPGFGAVSIKPVILADMDYVECSLKTVKGLVESSWRKKSGGVEFKITIPFNCKVRIYLPILQNNLEIISLFEDGTNIWFNGMKTGDAEGISTIIEEREYIMLEAGAGSYLFNLKSGI